MCAYLVFTKENLRFEEVDSKLFILIDVPYNNLKSSLLDLKND